MIKKRLFAAITMVLFLSASTGCSQNTPLNGNIAATNAMGTFSGKTVRNPQTISLTTYNIRNLFPANSTTVNSNKSEKQKIALSKAIHEINSDIIAFQEVESKTVFKSFTEKYLKDLNYHLYINDAPGQVKVAVLSRYAVSDTKNIITGKPKNSAPVIPANSISQLNFRVNNNYNFNLFVAYLKPLSNPGYTPEQRDEDIKNMKEFFKGFQNLTVNFAVLANFNDKPDSPALLTMLDPRSSGLNFHDVVSEDLGKGPDVYTISNPQNRIRTDYLLVSAGMFNEYVTGSVVINKPVNDGSTVKNPFFLDASDHLPITAKFDITADN